MATTLPPMAKVSMICIWIETVLYGINCIMYGLSMFILLRGSKIASLRWVLVVMSTILFVLCSIHVGASLRQLLEAYVYVPPNVPNYSTTYWLNSTNSMTILKHYLYNTLILAQYSILIWRLYVVLFYNWKVIVFPIILAVALYGTLCAVSTITAVPTVSVHGAVVTSLIESAWVLDMLLNVPITVTIAVRLWWLGRKAGFSMMTRANQYASSTYVVVESGAITLITNILILALYTTKSPASFPILDVASQLAGLTPLLIVVQVGLTGRYRMPNKSIGPSGDFSTAVITQQDEIVFRPVNLEAQDLGPTHIPLDTVTKLSRSESSAGDVA